MLIGEKKQPKANSLPTQGSLRQLLRTFVAFRRFGGINSGLLFHFNYTTNLTFFTLKFSLYLGVKRGQPLHAGVNARLFGRQHGAFPLSRVPTV